MGVDIDTYRGRIGTFSYQFGLAVVTVTCVVNFSRVLKYTGSVIFIGVLLIIAGIEQNPGPNGKVEKAVVHRVLIKALPEFVERLELTAVLDKLLSKGILTPVCARDIRDERNTSDGIRKLIYEIDKRHAETYNAFITSLIETNQKGLTDHLNQIEEDIRNEKVSMSSKPDNPVPDDSDTEEDIFYDTQNEIAESKKNAEIERILNTLGLTEKFKRKIKISDAIKLNFPDNASKGDRDIPFMFLQRLLSANSDAMDYRSYQTVTKMNAKVKGSVRTMYQPKDLGSISPLDLFLLVFQCCDPMLKQLLFQKIYLCKIAFPFIYKKYMTLQPLLTLWPLRSLVIETLCETSHTLEDFDLLELPINVVSFARFGRPNFSKSKLLNGLLCEKGSETFFHKDRPLGMSKRYAVDGYVEMFILPVINAKDSEFDHPVMFLNLRGDLRNDFKDVCQFVSNISDVTAVVVETSSFCRYETALEDTIKRFSSVVLIISGPLGPRDGEIFQMLENFEKRIINRYDTRLQIVASHFESSEKNYTDIIGDTREEIAVALQHESIVTKCLEDRLQNTSIETDENKDCKEACRSAKEILKSMDQKSAPDRWVECVTPIQNTSSKQLGILLKEYYRSTDLSVINNIKTQMSEVRSNSLRGSQGYQITETIKMFCHALTEHKHDFSYLQYFLQWIKIFLEGRKRMHKREKSQEMTDMKNSDIAYLDLNHLFREIGHICDSAESLKVSHDLIGFPPFPDLANVIANLVSNGNSFELLDGKSFYMPTEWIKSVLGIVHKLIDMKTVLTLSVLGIQSSGKSTLLNTMFGLQFPTSSGQCTRGVHMQLIPFSKGKSSFRKPFEYILVIDTEGVRAPELFDTQETGYKRDNELSTIITGLGDITMLNVMGESTAEMRDILQILTHAFLRLKIANNRLDIRKSCFFIHQNVSDMRALEKMESGLKQSVKNLDKATKEAADFEGISDITTFNQVIEFDPKSNVWYLPNYWQGYQPMASANQKYCNKIVELNNHLIQKSLNDKSKSFKTLHDTFLQIDDLWKGVLAENFVFSFRNSIEKKAYIELERKLKEELWGLECSVNDSIFPLVQSKFNQCDDVRMLRSVKEEVIMEMNRTVSLLGSETKKSMDIFFAENNYKDTTIKWKEFSFNRIRVSCDEVITSRKVEIDRLSKQREVDIMISVQCTKHDEELRRKSLELAKELRPSGKKINEDEANKRFEEIWKVFLEDSLSADTFSNFEREDVLRDDIIKCLRDNYDNHQTLLFSTLKEYDNLEKKIDIENLAGSFNWTGLTEHDISLPSAMSKLARKFTSSSKKSVELLILKENLENVFVMIDNKVKENCQKNREITKRDIKQFLNEVDCLINNILRQNNDSFTLKTTGMLKLVVYISCYSYSRFKKENVVHQQGIKVRLEIYKKRVHGHFLAHLMERNTEETAAILMLRGVEEHLRVWVKEMLPMKLRGVLRDRLPMLKYNLLLDILSELVQEESKEVSFNLFMRYILSPNQYAHLWLTEKAEHMLFSDSLKMFEKVAEDIISAFINDVEEKLNESVKSFPEYILSVEEWMQKFLSLTERQFPKESFRDVVKELERLERVQLPNFKNKVIEELRRNTSFSTLLDEIKATTEENVKWSSRNPIADICNDVWGCPEQCLFCGEPCIKGYQHQEESSHICLQHRPLGCCGVYEEVKGAILLNSCNVNILLKDAQAPCSVINFRCNPENREPCMAKWHYFKEYKTIAPDWDIEPTSDMHDRSTFWMWFIGEYDQELSKYHRVDVTNVPKSWKEISKAEAISSLRKLYKMDNLDT